MRFRRTTGKPRKLELSMTPMIDIVFQLLVFFVMTFKIVLPEGDFHVRQPRTDRPIGLVLDHSIPPLQVELESNEAGRLTGIRVNDRLFGTSFDAMRGHLISVVGPERGPGSIAETAEVEFTFDRRLRYAHMIRAVESVSGYRDDYGSVVSLIEKIKFRKPK